MKNLLNNGQSSDSVMSSKPKYRCLTIKRIPTKTNYEL